MGRLIVFSNEMDEILTESGGLLKVGLYAPKQGVGDIASRFKQSDEARPSWLRNVYPENPWVDAELKNVDALLDSLGYSVHYLLGDGAEVKPKIHLKANFFASGTAWNKLMVRPELADILRFHIKYLTMQAAPADTFGTAPDVQDIPEDLKTGWIELIHGLLDDLTPAEKEELIYYFTVGSTNMDYRSMVMDGEVMVLLGGWQSLYGFMDFLLLPGLCEWLETTEELDALLPPPSGMTRALAGLMKLSL